MGKFKNLERVTCKELEKLDSLYEGKNEFSEADAKRYDMLVHAWKSLLTAEAMHEAAEEKEMGGMSYANRARNPYNGQYMSHEMGDGWSRSYGPAWYPYSHGNGGPWY